MITKQELYRQIIHALLGLIIVIGYVTKDVNTLSNLQTAQTMQKIDATTLAPSNSAGSASNFTYSIWFFIDDWNYRYGEPKVVFGRMSAPSKKGTGHLSGVNGVDPCPAIVLGAVENNINVSLACYPGVNQAPTTTGGTTVIKTCSVDNIPIQKWVNLLRIYR